MHLLFLSSYFCSSLPVIYSHFYSLNFLIVSFTFIWSVLLLFILYRLSSHLQVLFSVNVISLKIRCTALLLIKICSDYRGIIVAPLFVITCLIISIIAFQSCHLVFFYIIFFLPQMLTFIIYILPSRDSMKKFKTKSICGQLLMKLISEFH